jgi:ABC-type transport system involved in multi-copper enzyme maturation permease subunit
MTWELRRFGTSRTFWLQALGFFCFLLLIEAAQNWPNRVDYGRPAGGESISGFIAGTSALGLLYSLPTSLALLVLIVPFVSADGVTRDLQRRTYELLMTTTLPLWAYVWGRYLVGLLMSLGLALLMLAAILGMGAVMHLTVPEYPWPSMGAALLLWLGMVVPAIVLVSGVGFALATLLPHLSTPIKVAFMLVWMVGVFVVPRLGGDQPPTWYVNWDPTSAVTARGLLSQYSVGDLLRSASNEAHFQNALVAMENKLPAIGGWFTSHLLVGGLGLLLVLLVPFAFRRSRDVRI